MTPEVALKLYFGFDKFREGQLEFINAIARGLDVLGVMPTGAGKSICFQLPAMLLPGVTIVISPLISLMRDQVQSLIANGIPAAYINSSLTDTQISQTMTNVCKGQYKIVYVAPERLHSYVFIDLAKAADISLVAVDEAHCISHWGQDFRPSYLDIPRFVESLPVRPVLAAFTATATPRVREDILRTLKLTKPLTMVTGFDRPNLFFEVKQPKAKYDALTQYLKDKDNCGVIYCSTRKEVESVTEKLTNDGYSAARYHAGLSDKERSQAQDDFLYDRVKIIVATNAFGMGIDKSNVRFVIHYNMPQNVESYYQEAGRAGRDGLPADCILLYSRKDIFTALRLINLSVNPDEINRSKQLLNQMERYCETEGCLRRFILNYFGETESEDCGNCGNCNGHFEEQDVTIDAQKLLSHVTRLNKQGYQLTYAGASDILLGKSEEFTDLPTFGIMRGSNRHYIRTLINKLTVLGYLSDEKVLCVTQKAGEVLFGGVKVTLKVRESANKDSSRNSAEPRKHILSDPSEPRKHILSDPLFLKLKKLRLTIAKEDNVPAFVVFSDAALVDMCQKHPRTESELLAVSGVGQVKLERYGDRFLELLCSEYPHTAQVPEESALTLEVLVQNMEFDGTPLPVSRVADNINAVLLRLGKPKVSAMKLNKLLVASGHLEITDDNVKVPTSLGFECGIIESLRRTAYGEFVQCLFAVPAQRLCAELTLQSFA